MAASVEGEDQRLRFARFFTSSANFIRSSSGIWIMPLSAR